MSRLTELIDIDGMKIKVSKERPLSNQGLGEILHKLYALEDIEQELGCPLEVFFKILKEKNYYFEYNGKVYYNKKCYINTVNLDDGFISVSVSNEELRNKYIFDVKLFFNEHKKTWWLSETKVE